MANHFIHIRIDNAGSDRFEFTLKKMHFEYHPLKLQHIKGSTVFVIGYNDPVELFYLGQTSCADSINYFSSGITQ